MALMSLSFDVANDNFTRGIIRRKALQISQRLGSSEQDLESLEQTLLTKVIKAMPSFNPGIAHRNVFITTVVERHAARLLPGWEKSRFFVPKLLTMLTRTRP
jgi:hypothetical protein